VIQPPRQHRATLLQHSSPAAIDSANTRELLMRKTDTTQRGRMKVFPQDGSHGLRRSSVGFLRCFGFTLALMALMVAPASAERYELVKRGKPGESYRYSDVPGGVCEAYEKNLARFADIPYGMACGRKLDPALGFTRPTWEKLDVLQHAELMRDIYRKERWDTFRDFDSRPFLERLKESVAHGMVLEIARVDLNGDGKMENLARVTISSERSCDPKEEIKHHSTGRKPIVIVDSTLSKVEATTLVKDDVFLYKGNVYSDALYGFGFSEEVRRKQGRDAELFLFGFLRYGAGAKCKFHYNAVPRNQPDSKGGSKP